ncbi:MAG TPA: hypothetical protein VG818_10585 [Gemmatimonadaceae bacterium]|nr:hypothetical protein [Gemmatimonadaceae bacterium]
MHTLLRRLTPLALLAGLAGTLPAQSVWDASARVGPQFMQYDIKAPVNEKISEIAVPVYVLFPITQSFSMDVGTSWAQARVESPGTNGASTVSQLSGFTDTQIRANYSIGTDFIVLTAGVDLPTGKQTALPSEQAAATLIASDFLLFPIAGFGTGAGGTGGIAIAEPIGDWNLGFGAAVKYSASYDPFQNADGSRFHFQPGNEYRARVGLDHPYGTGRVSFGVTYSKFGNDQAEQFAYNTGDRVIGQASVTNSVGGADVAVSAWDLYRASGQVADGTRTGRENIASGAVAVGFHSGDITIEPSVEGRVWTQDGFDTSYMGIGGLRANFNFNGFAVTPFVGYAAGSMAGSAGASSLSGFRGTLAIRLGGQ